MDLPTLNRLVELVTHAHRPTVVEVPGESRRECLVFDPAENRYVAREKRIDEDRRFLSLPTLADYAKAAVSAFVAGDHSFWVARTGVVLDLEDGDAATLPLTLSAPLRQLAEWSANPTPLKQERAVLLLRTLFPGAATPGDLLKVVSGIDWKVNEAGKSVVGNGQRSVGKLIEAKLENREKIPDTVIFRVPVWETGGELVTGIEAQVWCVLDTNPSTQTFLFVPEAGAVEDAIGRGEAELEQRLRTQIARAFGGEGGPPVYHGTPSRS